MDLDEDGDLDVATANRHSDDVSVFVNQSVGGVYKVRLKADGISQMSKPVLLKRFKLST